VIFEVLNKPHLNGGADLVVMGADCDWFEGHGDLLPGSKIEIVEDGVKHIVVPTALSLRFKIIGDTKEQTFSTFWSYFKPRVLLI